MLFEPVGPPNKNHIYISGSKRKTAIFNPKFDGRNLFLDRFSLWNFKADRIATKHRQFDE